MKKDNAQTSSTKISIKTIDEEISYILQNCDYLSDFLVDEKNPLGKGSFGVVFKAKRKSDGEELAMKIFLDNNDFQKIKDEIYVMFSLRRNPHILTICDEFIDPIKNLGIVVMEKADISLKNIIDSNPSDVSTLKDIYDQYPFVFDLKYLMQMILDILTGLKYALTEKKYSHSDIKPSNILVFFNINRDELKGAQKIFVLRKNHVFKLGDWGNSKISGSSIDHTTQMSKWVGGTEHYIAPEIMNEKEEINLAKADIYSFGLTIFACCGADSKEFKSLNSMRKELDHRNYFEMKLSEYQIKNKYGDDIENLLRNMVKFNSKERIDINQMFKIIQDIIEKITDKRKDVFDDLKKENLGNVKKNEEEKKKNVQENEPAGKKSQNSCLDKNVGDLPDTISKNI